MYLVWHQDKSSLHPRSTWRAITEGSRKVCEIERKLEKKRYHFPTIPPQVGHSCLHSPNTWVPPASILWWRKPLHSQNPGEKVKHSTSLHNLWQSCMRRGFSICEDFLGLKSEISLRRFYAVLSPIHPKRWCPRLQDSADTVSRAIDDHFPYLCSVIVINCQ